MIWDHDEPVAFVAPDHIHLPGMEDLVDDLGCRAGPCSHREYCTEEEAEACGERAVQYAEFCGYDGAGGPCS